MPTIESPRAHEALLAAARSRGWSKEATRLLGVLVADRAHDPAALREILAAHTPTWRPRRVLNWFYALTPEQTSTLAERPRYAGPRHSRPFGGDVLSALTERARHMATSPDTAIPAWNDVFGPDLAPYTYLSGLSVREADDLYASGRLDVEMLYDLARLRGVETLHPAHPF